MKGSSVVGHLRGESWEAAQQGRHQIHGFCIVSVAAFSPPEGGASRVSVEGFRRKHML